MKNILPFLALLILHANSCDHHCDIRDELKDFLNLLPVEKLRLIVDNHLENDRSFREVIRYFHSGEWLNMIYDVLEQPEWQKLQQQLLDLGIDIEHVFSLFNEVVQRLKPKVDDEATKANLRPFLDEIEETIPFGKLLTLFHEKKRNSTHFKEFFRKISSEDVHELVEGVKKLPQVKVVFDRLNEMGMRVNDVFELLYGFMGWNTPRSSTMTPINRLQRSLKEDFDDFWQLIPVEQLKKISEDHLENDKEFGDIVVYFQGPEWANIVDKVRARPEWKEFKAYLKEAGIDIDAIIRFLSDLIGNARPGTIRSERSLRTYLDEVEDVIPLEKLLNMLNDKMEHSLEFQEFIKKISSKKARKLVDEIRQIPEVVLLCDRLQEMGVRVREALVVIYAFLGWGSPFSNN